MDWKFLFTSFDGRINRAKFWAGLGVMLVVLIVAAIIDNIIGTTIPNLPYGYVYLLASLAGIYFMLAVYAKRWHDRDKSGWWTLIGLVPFIGAVWLLVECGILEGTRGPNRFGSDPLA